jgi:hypothetical protein
MECSCCWCCSRKLEDGQDCSLPIPASDSAPSLRSTDDSLPRSGARWRRLGTPSQQDVPEEPQLPCFCSTGSQEFHTVKVTSTIANHAS